MEDGHRHKFVSPCTAAAAVVKKSTSSLKAINPVKKTKRTSLVYCGHFFQCVQGARFFLLKTYGLTFSDVNMAHQIFDMMCFYRVVIPQEDEANGDDDKEKEMNANSHSLSMGPVAGSNNNYSSNNRISSTILEHNDPHCDLHHRNFEQVPVWTVGNGDSAIIGNFSTSTCLSEENQKLVTELEFDKKPVSGNVLIWVDSGFFKYTGHIAIVTEVVKRENDEKYPFGVRVWEQNFDDSSWNGRDYSRELPAVMDDETGKLEIIEPIYGSVIKGWMATKCMLEHERRLRSTLL